MENKKDDLTVPGNAWGLTLTEDEEKDLLRYVKPHTVKSRLVTNEDLARVAEEAKILYHLCFLPIGRYMGGEAVAHSQIDDKDPLQLFVLKNKDIIINSVILNYTNTTIEKLEGCLTYYENEMILVPRWNKVTVKYQTLMKDGSFSGWMEENINGRRSEVFQHEQDHNDGVYIYKLTK